MFKFIVIVLIIIFLSKECLSEDLQILCDRNPIVRVKYAFNLKDVTLLGLEMDSKVLPFKLKGLKFQNQKLTRDSVEEWNDWNKKSDNTEITELLNFNSTVRIFNPNKTSQLIFITKDPKSESLMGYEVEYNQYMAAIESAKPFHFDPNKDNDKDEDFMNLKSIYEKFPGDYYTAANPIVSFPIDDQTLPKRIFVYYYEADQKDKDEDQYMLHIFIEKTNNGAIEWIRDIASHECLEIDKTKKVDSAIAITDSSGADKKFDLIEFYENGNYGIKSVSIDTTDPQNTSVSMSFIHEADIKESIGCKFSEKSATSSGTTASNSSGSITMSSDDNKEPGSEKYSTSGSKKSSGAMIYVVLIVVLLLIFGALLLLYFCLKRNRGFYSPEVRQEANLTQTQRPPQVQQMGLMRSLELKPPQTIPKPAQVAPTQVPLETSSEAASETPSKAPSETQSKASSETPSKAPSKTSSKAPSETPSKEPPEILPQTTSSDTSSDNL